MSFLYHKDSDPGQIANRYLHLDDKNGIKVS